MGVSVKTRSVAGSFARGAAAAICLALGVAGAASAQGLATAQSASPEVGVPVGKSQVVELPAPYTDLMIADPKIADVLPLTNHSVYVVG